MIRENALYLPSCKEIPSNPFHRFAVRCKFRSFLCCLGVVVVIVLEGKMFLRCHLSNKSLHSLCQNQLVFGALHNSNYAWLWREPHAIMLPAPCITMVMVQFGGKNVLCAKHMPSFLRIKFNFYLDFIRPEYIRLHGLGWLLLQSHRFGSLFLVHKWYKHTPYKHTTQHHVTTTASIYFWARCVCTAFFIIVLCPFLHQHFNILFIKKKPQKNVCVLACCLLMHLMRVWEEQIWIRC